MKNKTAFALVAGLLACPGFSLTSLAEWTVQFGSATSDQINDLAVDLSGNVYAGGFARGPVLGQTYLGEDEAVLAKYNSAGGLLWVREFGTTAFDVIDGVALAGSGVVVGGHSSGALGGAASGNLDCFVRLYDSAGAVQWTRQFGTSTAEQVHTVGADAFGHVYAAGYTGGSFSGPNAGGRDLFIRQFNASTGATNWTRQFGTVGDEYGRAIVCDAAGNVFVGGHTTDSLFGTDAGGTDDAFVMKLDVSGSVLWSKQYGTTGSDAVWGLSLDAGGNVIAAGYTGGTLGAASAGNVDVVVRKLDGADGSTLWTSQFGTSARDLGLSVASDSLGQIIVGGYTDGVYPGKISFGGRDATVHLLDPSGHLLATQQFGTSGADLINAIVANAIGVVTTGGSTTGAFAPFTNAGGTDAFVRYTAVPEPATAAFGVSLFVGVLLRRQRCIERRR